MSGTFFACMLIAFAWMGLFFIWGRFFLSFIHAKCDIASSVLFGYLILQVVYQILYLPFYLTRGSYRSLSFIWIGIIGTLSVLLLFYFRKHSSRQKLSLKASEKTGLLLTGICVLAFAVYIPLHVPYYGADTVKYISTMNECYYRDTMWISSGRLFFHYGMCSMFQFFTISSLLTGIKPYYIALFTIRIVGICMTSMVIYRTGITVFRKAEYGFCWPAAVLAVLAPFLLMFWGSMYTAEFYYWRINEAKGYCQFILLPIGFSVFLAMFRKDADIKSLWKEQLLVGLAAVSISGSSLTSYLFLLFIGTFSLLIYDKLKGGWITIGRAFLCALPNLTYLLVYVLEKNGTIVL